MSKHYTAYQYEAAYRPQALRNWEVPKFQCDRPFPRHGRTSIISNSRGHLLPGVFRSHNLPWGNYLGTWEMPKYIDKHTANILNGTIEGKERIRKCKQRLLQLSQPKKATTHKVPQEETKPAEKLDSKTEVAGKVDSKQQHAERPVANEASQEPESEVKEQEVEVKEPDVEVRKPKIPCPIHDLYDAGVPNKN
ncbi:unnamed protein product [Callosobruchus maculatus]|uniref:Cilia- and flagella-associated protein 126 n=1 Tax=Callosobruchus maculatus TaxID=64391 RepID=A0A653DV48_CALMS|nr:unnamed protein product [Callosobruchus maculatus]